MVELSYANIGSACGFAVLLIYLAYRIGGIYQLEKLGIRHGHNIKVKSKIIPPKGGSAVKDPFGEEWRKMWQQFDKVMDQVPWSDDIPYAEEVKEQPKTEDRGDGRYYNAEWLGKWNPRM